MASRHWCKRTATNAVITIDDLDIVISWLFTDINATSYRVRSLIGRERAEQDIR